MDNLFYVFFLKIFLNLILTICAYFDLKYRKIPNQLFKIFFSLSGFLCVITTFSTKDIIYSLALRVIFILLAFSVAILLYFLKIIGGGDGKLLILIYILLPTEDLIIKYFIWFFFNFYIIFFILCFINLLKNMFGNYYSFDFLFSFYIKGSKINNLYYLLFYRFLDISELDKYNNVKTQIKSSTIIFNNSNKKLQIITQLRSPLIIVCALSFNFVYLI